MNVGEIYNRERIIIDRPDFDTTMIEYALNNYRAGIETLRSIDCLSQNVVIDSVEFRNFLDHKRPYYHLDVDGFFSCNDETWVIAIRDAVLLAEGWHLGGFKIVPNDQKMDLLSVSRHNTQILGRNHEVIRNVIRN